jgi:hypothetical protein
LIQLYYLVKLQRAEPEEKRNIIMWYEGREKIGRGLED